MMTGRKHEPDPTYHLTEVYGHQEPTPKVVQQLNQFSSIKQWWQVYNREEQEKISVVHDTDCNWSIRPSTRTPLLGDSNQTTSNGSKILCKPHEVYKVHWLRPPECCEVVDDSYLPELSFDFGVYLVIPIEILAGRMLDLEVRRVFKHIYLTNTHSAKSWRFDLVMSIPEETWTIEYCPAFTFKHWLEEWKIV